MLRGGSRTAATSKIERFVIIVNDFQLLTITAKHSIFDVAAVLDPHQSYIFIVKTEICIEVRRLPTINKKSRLPEN